MSAPKSLLHFQCPMPRAGYRLSRFPTKDRPPWKWGWQGANFRHHHELATSDGKFILPVFSSAKQKWLGEEMRFWGSYI